MTRRVVAALACRLRSSRLYAKPLQPLADGVSILDQIVASLAEETFIDRIVLAIADAPENRWLDTLATHLGCAHVFGDPSDVLGRLILAGNSVGATDIVRKTTESPFMEFHALGAAWRRHLEEDNDVTVVDYVPLGTAIEIYTMAALERSHAEGRHEDRSEFVSNYARFNQARFRIGIVEPPTRCRRTDLRLTVDYPEDLIVCRTVYKRFRSLAPRIPLDHVIDFLDGRPDLTALVSRYVNDAPLWAGAPQRT